MEKKYITDTDFLPKELTHYHGIYSDEMTDDLYQIIYGILAPSQTLSKVYEDVVRVVSREKSPAIRKFKLQTWKKSIDAILKTLNKVDTKGFEVIVYVPLRDCEMTISAVQSYLQLAIFTISELLESDSIPEPTFPNDQVPDLKKLFEESYSGVFTMLDDYEPDFTALGWDDSRYQHAEYWKAIILDEMYRRGIETVNLKGEEEPILPSEYYGDSTLYNQTFIEKGMMLEPELESDDVPMPGVSETLASDNDTIGTRAAVMYYMLNSFCPVTDDNFNRAVALIDFAVGKQSPKFNVNKANDTEINKVNNNNSIKTYVRKFRDNSDYLNEPTADKIRARLSEQGFEVPASYKSKKPWAWWNYSLSG